MFRTFTRPNPRLAIIITLLTILFGAGHILIAITQSISSDINLLDWSLVFLKLTVELGALFYGVAFVCIGFTYLFLAPGRRNEIPIFQTEGDNQQTLPPVGVIYLCCNDLDRDALMGISKLNYEGALKIIVHDDSADLKSQSEVNSIVSRVRQCRSDIDISLLRRPNKGGGKAAVMNYILHTTGNEYEYFIMCDMIP